MWQLAKLPFAQQHEVEILHKNYVNIQRIRHRISRNARLVQWHYIRIFRTEFHSYRSINVKITLINFFQPLCTLWWSLGWFSPNFCFPEKFSQRSPKLNFKKISPKGLVTHNRSQTDGRPDAVFTYGLPFLLCKERLIIKIKIKIFFHFPRRKFSRLCSYVRYCIF
jgi:hypothetical protein